MEFDEVIRSVVQSLQLDPTDDIEESVVEPPTEEVEIIGQDDRRVETEEPEADSQEANKKRHVNVIFIGHVDAGKSTTGGQILFLSGKVDDRTIQKYKEEAKRQGRESWYMAYIMDTDQEERAKGKTVHVGESQFETESTKFTILDAPGHKTYIPNMIGGVSKADVGVLVISARRGEFEAGFERSGQNREHVLLAKTLGVSKLVVVVNKMDDPTVEWGKERYHEIESKMVPFLRICGYRDVQFLPISGLVGSNIKTRLDKAVCSWYDGPSLFEVLDAIEIPAPDPNGPFRMPVLDISEDMGITVIMGKVESGSVQEGDTLLMMPKRIRAKVVTIYSDDEDAVIQAGPGENIGIRFDQDVLSGEKLKNGLVVSSVERPVPAVTEFNAQLQILDKAFICSGYTAVLHIHCVTETCEIIELLHLIDPKTMEPTRKKAMFVKSGDVVKCRIGVVGKGLLCIEKFSDFPQLGRFTLRSNGSNETTIAVGKVTDLLPSGAAGA